VHFALEGTTGWRFVVEEVERAGHRAHLADPAETAAKRGRKRRAKTDRASLNLAYVDAPAGPIGADELPARRSPEHVHVAEAERAQVEERPVVVRHEQERCCHRFVAPPVALCERPADRLDLGLHPLNELRAVAAADVEAQIGLEPAAEIALLDAAFVVLGVDHEDASLADDEVVDVRPRAWNTAVVQDGDPLLAQPVEAVPDRLLATSACRPGGRRVRVGGEGEQQPAEALVLGTDLRLSPLVALLRSEAAHQATRHRTGEGSNPAPAIRKAASGGFSRFLCTFALPVCF
jgi:hypothetical protein